MRLTAVAVAVLALSLAGCQAATTDKAGNTTVVLRLATVDAEVNSTGQDFGQKAFVDALNSVSNGKLKAEVGFGYGSGTKDPESALVRAIAHGEVDGGWPASRAFAAAGIPGLKAFEVPFALTSYDALRELLGGAATDQAIAALVGSGIHGLGLTIAGLRRPFTTRAMRTADSWSGVRMRVMNSPVEDATFAALGAIPVHTRLDWRDQVAAGTLTLGGAELAVPVAAADGMPFGYYPSNLVLWPKVAVLSVNENRFDALSPQQHGWLAAAARAAEDASSNGRYNEGEFVQTLCRSGVQPYAVPAEVVATLRSSVQPVIDGLARDPAEAGLLRNVLAVAAKYPKTDATTQAASCAPTSSQNIPYTVAPVPDGRYRVQVTNDDLEQAHVSNSDGYTGTWTITVADGTYAVTCSTSVSPADDCGRSGVGPDVVLEAGNLRGDDEVVHFVYDRALHDRYSHCGSCQPLPTKSVGWRLQGDQLTFYDVGMPVGDQLLLIKAWTKLT